MQVIQMVPFFAGQNSTYTQLNLHGTHCGYGAALDGRERNLEERPTGNWVCENRN